MIKAVLASLDGLAADVAKEYKKGSDGKFYLELEGVEEHPATGALKRAKDREHDERLAAEKKVAEATERLKLVETEHEEHLKKSVPKENLEALERSYTKKLADREKELTTENQTLTEAVREATVTREASALASKIAGDNSKILLPHILPRLSVELVKSGTKTVPEVRVVGADGKPSALTIADFEKEIVADPTFSAIVVASKASGGSAKGSSSGNSVPKVDYTNISPADGVAAIKAKHGSSAKR